MLWIALSLAVVWMGWRFFPRYFFHLLPGLLILAARGASLAPRRWRMGMAALLLIPLARFLPATLQLGVETLRGAPHASADLALYEDARGAAAIVKPLARPGDGLLVWGYRPELYLLTGLNLGTRFLDSQPLNGVLADRHLQQSRATFPELAARNRAALMEAKAPEWLLDGLGPINPELDVFNGQGGLTEWRNKYVEIGRTRTVIVYRLRGEKTAPMAENGREKTHK
jgi:hypothetical protein